ncbi:MAG TPA: hypothetical protein ENI80_10810 [Acidiferrobacteraceae bacterium]|nr:hypothetical protein [Acidiferrobacteraceae bacterium]
MTRYDSILPELIVGAHPRVRSEIRELKEQLGVTAVLNLQTNADMDQLGISWNGLLNLYQGEDITIRRLPITDFDVADLRTHLPAGAQALEELIRSNHKVYLHCTLGVERSPSVAVAFLTWYRDWPLDKAWKHVKECRECLPNFEALWLSHEQRKEGLAKPESG